MSKTVETLRQERLSYLNGKKRTTAPAKPTKPAGKVANASTAPKATDAPAPAPAAQQTPATQPVVETITATVVDPRTLSKTASFELSLYGQGTSNPHWLIVADGHPVGEIQYADQDAAQLPVDLFVSDQYATSVVQAMSQEDPAKILASLKARTFVAAVEKSAAFDAVRKEVVAQADTEVRLARAELRANLMNVLGLVLKAQAKNFITANDLKAELFDQLTAVGVEERTAAHVIEAAWQKSATDTFDACLKQAEEWMDLPVEAYRAIEKQIDGMDARPVEPVTTASAHDVPSERYNVAISTRVAGAAGQAPSAVDFNNLFRIG